MVVTQQVFNKALEEINASYAKLVKRVAELESKVAELEAANKPEKKTTK